MIRIINESDDNFDIENMIFTINIYLPIFHTNEHEKEFVISEDWKIDRDMVIPNRKMSDGELDDMLQRLNRIITYHADNTINILVDAYNMANGMMYNVLRVVQSNQNKITNNTQSYAHYVEVECDVSNIQCSEKVENSIKTFKIRIANHISKSEFKTLQNMDNVKIYHNQMLDLCEEQFSIYVTNILNGYGNFIDTLSNYPCEINKFSDIREQDISKLKQIAVQGRFEDYEKKFRNNL